MFQYFPTKILVLITTSFLFFEGRCLAEILAPMVLPAPPKHLQMLVEQHADGNKLTLTERAFLQDLLVRSPEVFSCTGEEEVYRNIGFEVRQTLMAYHAEDEATVGVSNKLLQSAMAAPYRQKSLLLRKLVLQYLPTAAGQKGLVHLLSHSYDRGDLDICSFYADAWMQHPKTSIASESGTGFKAAVCYAGANRSKELVELLPKLKGVSEEKHSEVLIETILPAAKQRRASYLQATQKKLNRFEYSFSDERTFHFLTLLNLRKEWDELKMLFPLESFPKALDSVSTCEQITWVYAFSGEKHGHAPDPKATKYFDALANPRAAYDSSYATDLFIDLLRVYSFEALLPVYNYLAENTKSHMVESLASRIVYQLGSEQQTINAHNKLFRFLALIVDSPKGVDVLRSSKPLNHNPDAKALVEPCSMLYHWIADEGFRRDFFANLFSLTIKKCDDAAFDEILNIYENANSKLKVQITDNIARFSTGGLSDAKKAAMRGLFKKVVTLAIADSSLDVLHRAAFELDEFPVEGQKMLNDMITPTLAPERLEAILGTLNQSPSTARSTACVPSKIYIEPARLLENYRRNKDISDALFQDISNNLRCSISSKHLKEEDVIKLIYDKDSRMRRLAFSVMRSHGFGDEKDLEIGLHLSKDEDEVIRKEAERYVDFKLGRNRG